MTSIGITKIHSETHGSTLCHQLLQGMKKQGSAKWIQHTLPSTSIRKQWGQSVYFCCRLKLFGLDIKTWIWDKRWTFQPLFPGIYIQIWYTTYDSIICNGTPNFQVGKSIGTDRLKIDESEKNLTFTCKFLLAITASSVWPNNITEHRSFVMFFQAFTAASFSCCLFWGISPYSLLFCR